MHVSLKRALGGGANFSPFHIMQNTSSGKEINASPLKQVECILSIKKSKPNGNSIYI